MTIQLDCNGYIKRAVYLCGNIAGLTYEDATTWRNELTSKLQQAKWYEFVVLDPMRDKQQLAGSIVGFTHNSANCTAEEIFDRDVNDINNSDVIFCYLTNYSIGTCWELGYSWANQKYIIVVTTDELIQHPFLSQSADYITTSFEDGVEHLINLGDVF